MAGPSAPDDAATERWVQQLRAAARACDREQQALHPAPAVTVTGDGIPIAALIDQAVSPHP
jgi:hypothetical protein